VSRVTIVDYGIGNLLSVQRACEYWGAEVEFIDSPSGIEKAEHLILPGVGAFADGMAGLRERGIVDSLRKYASQDRPFMGICLGMQMMLEVGEEFGKHEGLGIIPGTVVKIVETGVDGQNHKIPHIGWNSLCVPAVLKDWNDTVLQGIVPGSAVYFVHSYTAVPANDMNRLADCDYNGRIVSAAIHAGNLYGCQFHPEKSGMVGQRIFKNFLYNT
jgi:glutamine amidotransferase